MELNIIELSNRIHQQHIMWWRSLEDSESIDRNEGELIALVHSELSEGYVGMLGDAMDDHLPHRRMVEVELADALIRIMDFIGGFRLAENVQLEYLELFDGCEKPKWNDMSYHEMFARLQSEVSDWLESTRKNRISEVRVNLAQLIYDLQQVTMSLSCDLFGAMEEKLAYNKTRADHQHANRQQQDGKKF